MQLVNFSVVPTYLQIPFCAGVSFVWTVILSMMRGSDTGAAVTEDGEAVLTAGAAQPQTAAATDKPECVVGDAGGPASRDGGAADVPAAESAAAGLSRGSAVPAAASVAEPLRLRRRCAHAQHALARAGPPQLSFASGRVGGASAGRGGRGHPRLSVLLHLQHPLHSAAAAAGR